jgi:hypothetical protein
MESSPHSARFISRRALEQSRLLTAIQLPLVGGFLSMEPPG